MEDSMAMLSIQVFVLLVGGLFCYFVAPRWNIFNGPEPQDDCQRMLITWGRHYTSQLGLRKIQDEAARIEKLVELAEKSDDGKLCYVAGTCLHDSDPARASDFYRRAFESPGFPEEVKWQAADGFITLALFTDPKPHMAKMDEYSQQLLAAKPQDLSVHGTRGSVLIELGRIEEGKRMLEGVLEKDENLNDRAICATYLAYAAHLEQRPNDVEKYMSWALESDSVNPILKRFAFLLPPEKKA